MIRRRDFLKTASAATLGAFSAGASKVFAESADLAHSFKPTADTVILLWMGGGMAHTETFDPKRYTPFEKGMQPNGVLSTFPSIDTAVDPIKFSEGLEKIGAVMDRGTLIRSSVASDLGFILHSRHQFHWHTGYVPPQTVAAPHLGAIIARTLGPLNPAVPAFLNIGQRFDIGEGEEVKAFTTAGFLGSEYGPFNIPFPEDAASAVRPPAGMTPGRFERRNTFYKKMLEASPIGEFGSTHQRDSFIRAMDNAHQLLSSPAAKAFDLSLEPKESVARYVPEGFDPARLSNVKQERDGNYEASTIGRFGLGCLLAKRLADVGARFIEVTTEYIPFLNWDTHENGHTRLVNMKKMIDAPIAQLIRDLEEMGRLDRTLVVLASEFSRDMMIEGREGAKVRDQARVPDRIEELKYYGMHRHFTDAGCVLMFGGGMKRGHLHGVTADERPCKAVVDVVPIEDLHATIFRALGMSPKLAYEVEQRPFYITRDGLGKPIESLFA